MNNMDDSKKTLPTSEDSKYVLRRERVERLLDKALAKPIVTVTAGPGCGKSSAVHAYVQSRQMRTLWIQLSESDNLPASFWEKFTNAISEQNAALARKIRDIELPADELSFRLFLELLSDEMKPRFRYAFVFDDLHTVNNISVLWFIRAFTEQLWVNETDRSFPGNTVVLMSREDCSLETSKLLTEGRLAVIAERDLNFTKNETMELFRFYGIPDSRELDQSIDDIYADTDGWAFLTSIAGYLLQTRTDGLKYIKTALRRSVASVIENELFLKNSDSINRFLVKVSLLEHISDELISGIEDGSRLIHEATQASSFIRYDSFTGIYYMHPMLRDFFLNKKDLLSVHEIHELYEIAAAWSLANEYKMDAATYYDKSGNYSAIIDIINTMPQVIKRDCAALLLELLNNASSEVIDNIPIIRVQKARLLISLGKTEQAERELSDIIAQYETLPSSVQRSEILLGAYYTLGFERLLVCNKTGEYDFGEYFNKAEPHLGLSGFIPSICMRIAVVAPFAIGIGRAAAGEPERFIEALSGTIPHVSKIMDGRMTGMDDLALSELCYYRCNMAVAKKYANQARIKAIEAGQYEIENRALFFLIRALLAEGKYPQIKEAVDYMEAQLGNTDFSNRFIRFDIQTGWFYGSIGQRDSVPNWLKSVFVSASDTVVSNLEDFARFKYFLSEQNYNAVLAIIDSRSGEYDISRYYFGQIGFAANNAVCLYNLKDKKAAFEALRAGYELAVLNQIDMPFIELGSHMRTLSEAALKAKVTGIPAAWLEMIQTKSSTYAKRTARVRSAYMGAEGIDRKIALTPKEIDILSDLSHGLSRSEIALERGISVNTVKMGLQHIFEKMDAENSIDAIRIGYVNGLLK